MTPSYIFIVHFFKMWYSDTGKEVFAMGYGNTEVFMTPEQREALIREYLGKTVDIVIDRPIGFHHVTKGIHLHYTVNYGYLPGVLGGDGEEQDVYVLGVKEPLETFRGKIIAVIRRRDDNEDKFVAAPEGMEFHQGQIMEQIHFVEKYFDSRIEPVFHLSCGVIPYRIEKDAPRYLLCHQRGSGSWSFPKGHMEAWETEEETALRELKEETGLEAVLVPGFSTVQEYALSEVSRKKLILFLGAVSGEVKIDPREILEYRWVTAEEAKALLPAGAVASMDMAEQFLRKG